MNTEQTSPLSSPALAGEVSAQQTEGVFQPIPQPKPEPTQDHLPAALTFFLTRQQRTQILRALKQLNPNRTAALINALNIK